ncbi:hypothetical protein [Actomonas aquatica]|uniref:Glycosyltransferase RgtA/B/C/D-like domain-containing protein n=1 Tax=Actomonas aquatica TaxID=2866162 RepID=A0ABZ1CDB7_9BACT|nr:hypothetical protein [Opitutus sp. WL0086]WRQ89554.1 hypothetical protein K1X11_009045 [Opitutus sp. WL0086]
MNRRVVLFVLVGLLAVLLGFITLTPAQAVQAVRDYGYWFVAISFGGLVFHLVREALGWWTAIGAGDRLRRVWRAWPVWLVVGLAALYLQVQEKHGFKIIADEFLLCSTAKQLHEYRSGAIVLRAYDYGGNFVTLNSRVDKRPLTFPFLLTLLHDTTGYRVENVFILNGLLSVALTALLFLIGHRLGGYWAGVSLVAWICLVPLVIQNAAGAGFELLNMVMILLVVWLGMRFAEQPEHRDRMGALIYATILLAQVRYESALFVVPVAGVILYGWWRAGRMLLPFSAMAAPLLLLPVPWLQNVFKLSEASWQLKDVEGATSPFGFQYFYDNVGHALNFFFTFDGSQPNAWLLALLGILAMGFAGLLIYQKGREYWQKSPRDTALLIAIIGLTLHAVLMLCYFWGKWDDPIIRRLSLPTHLLLALTMVWVWSKVPGLTRRWWILLGLAAFQWLGWSVPAIARQEYNAENYAARTTNWLSDFAAQQTAAGRRILVIDPVADLMWFLHNQSALNPYTLAKRGEEFVFHFEQGTFDDVYVVQRVIVDLATGGRFISAVHDYGPALTLEPVMEQTFAPTYVIRVSRVTAVDAEQILQWGKYQETLDLDSPTGGIEEVKLDVDALNEWIRKLP